MGRGGYAGLAVVPALAVALGALVYAWPGSVEGARTAAQSVAGAAGLPAGKRTNDPIEVVSWEPRAFVWRSFLSEKECEHIKKVAGPHLARSKVVDSKNGGETVDPIRTSNGTFIRRRSDSIISTIEDRVARFTHLPVANQEDLQVLSYGASDQYRDHMDTLGSRNDPVAGERTMSVLMYLADVKSGGETVFPKSAKWADPSSAPSPESLSSCARRGVAIKPRKGDALLFHDLTPNNEADPLSMHASCPVIDGLKWTATKWVHVGYFRPVQLGIQDPSACVDENKNCEGWARDGECSSNSQYMLNHCLRSCCSLSPERSNISSGCSSCSTEGL